MILTLELGLIMIILIIIVLYYILIKYNKNNYRRLDLPKTSFNILDKEHAEMADAIDHLYNLCKAHWDTEDKMYSQGVQERPASHPDTTTEWQKHTEQHRLFLEHIKQLKTDIINHITIYDIPHFHYGPD